jgi:uncharacterized protein
LRDLRTAEDAKNRLAGNFMALMHRLRAGGFAVPFLWWHVYRIAPGSEASQITPTMIEDGQRITLKQGRVGLISDTHGLLRPEALAALKGSELIIHAGDIGAIEVLEGLRAITRVFAIRGNNDRALWAGDLPDALALKINGVLCRVIHNVNELKIERARAAVVISGHSHKAAMVRRSGVLFINPGSAGPRRFKLPVTVARLKIAGGAARAQIVELKI